MEFFKKITAKTNPNDLSEGFEMKIIRREGAKANTIVVVNPNGKVKSLHWRMITKSEPKKAINGEETNNESVLNENREEIYYKSNNCMIIMMKERVTIRCDSGESAKQNIYI